jgi:hypothetical protein
LPEGYSVAQVLESLRRKSVADHAIIVRNPNVVPDARLFQAIDRCISDLNEKGLSSWLVLGAGGLGTEGQRFVTGYSRLEPSLRNFANIAPVVDTFPDLYLVNVGSLRRLAGGRLTGISNAGVELALIAHGYLEGFASVYHPGLFIATESRMRRDLDSVVDDVRRFVFPHILEDAITTLVGTIERDPRVDRSEPNSWRSRSTRESYREAIARVVEGCCELPPISVLIRTTFRRQELLRRNLAALVRATSRLETEIECILASSVEPGFAQSAIDELAREFPVLHLRHVRSVDVSVPSRTANLVAGIQASLGEYVWVVDDDDFVTATAFDDLKRAFFLGQRPFVVCSSSVFEERWSKEDGVPAVKEASRYQETYHAHAWTKAFTGVNPLPICSLVFPGEFIRRRTKDVRLRRDLSEDYALLLLALTGPDLPEIVEVDEPLCNISIRHDGDNTVTMVDRRPWLQGIAAFLDDLMSDPNAAGPGIWRLLQSNTERHQVDALQEQVDRCERVASRLRMQMKSKDAEIAGLRSLLASHRAHGGAEAPESDVPIRKELQELGATLQRLEERIRLDRTGD